MKSVLTAVLVLVGTSTPVLAAEPSESLETASTELSEPEPGPPEQANGQITPLDRGQRAPWTGMLIEQQDLVRWKLEIDNLRYRLDRDVQLATDRCDVKVQLQVKLLDIETQRANQIDDLWRERVEQLAADNVALQKDVAEANSRNFFEEPVVWYVGGVISAALLVLLAAQ